MVKAFPLARNEGGKVRLLGTGFIVRQNTLATAAHVLDGNDTNLIAIAPEQFNNDYSSYQNYPRQGDIGTLSLEIADIDPLHDVALLKCVNGSTVNSPVLPNLGSSDDAAVGDHVFSLSYPHALLGNTIMVVQHTTVGARVIIYKGGLKVRHIVVNQQTVLGQSGAPVYSSKNQRLLGILVGVYGIGAGSGISLGGIDPQTLHQTSFVVSAEYLAEMLR